MSLKYYFLIYFNPLRQWNGKRSFGSGTRTRDTDILKHFLFFFFHEQNIITSVCYGVAL